MRSEREAVLDGETAYQLRAPASKQQAIEGIANAMRFPSWFGGNLDALFDCLIDLSWLGEGTHVLVWTGTRTLADADPAAYEAIRTTVEDALAESSSLRVALID